MDITPFAWFSLSVAGAAGWGAFKLLRSRGWPRVEARVVEVEPQTVFERGSSNDWRLNLDSDHLLVYSVAGREYRHTIEDESSVTLNGIKLARRRPRTGPRSIRVNPRNPNDYVEPKYDRPWILSGCLGLSMLGLVVFVWTIR